MKWRSQKETGAYYTPDPVVASLIQWVVQHVQDRIECSILPVGMVVS